MTAKQENRPLEKKFTSKKEERKFLEFQVLKSIAGFLNAQGGQLVIGVHEKDNIKNVVGIKREGFDSNDHYERHLIQILKNNFSTTIVSNHIVTNISKIKNTDVCVVRCTPVEDDIIYLNGIVYIRTGPRTDEISGEEVLRLYKKKISLKK